MVPSGWVDRVLRILGCLVPRGDRDEWLQEWQAEVDHDADASPGAAVRLAAAAEDALGLRLSELRRDLRTVPGRDARFAARALARNPIFTGTVVLTLALGIGANAAVFTVVDAVLLKPLPYPAAERLVQLVWERDGRVASSVSTPDFDDLRERARTVEHLSLRVPTSLTYQADRPIVLAGASVSEGYLGLFGTTPSLGRYFLPDDDAPGATPSIVLSYGLWQRVFGGDPGIVGRTLTLEGQTGEAYVVVGVAEPQLRDPVDDVQFWTSRPAWIALSARNQQWLQVFGRIAANATLEDAAVELRTLSADLAAAYPDSNSGLTFEAVSLQERLGASVRPALLLLLAAVGLVLLITCANVTNLILVRGAGRARELAVRVSLGAGRARLTGQLIVEGFILATLGGAAGLAVAFAATRGLVAMGAPGVPRLAELHVDGTVLLFTTLATGLTTIVLGIVPILQVSGADPSRDLREAGRSGEGRGARRVRRALVAAELAVSVVLLVGAGLLIRSLSRIAQVDTGVRTAGVLTFRVSPPQAAFSTPAELRLFYENVRANLSRLPEVDAVGGVSLLPLTVGTWYDFIREDAPPATDGPLAELRTVEPGYFRSVGIPLVAGRLLDGRDGVDAPPALLVDQAMGREHFPGESPIGKRITVPWGAGIAPVSYEIVGVVGEVRHEGPTSAPGPTLYVPRGGDTTPYWLNRSMAITVHTRGDPLDLAESARRAVWDVDPTVPITQMDALDRYLEGHYAGPRNEALLVGFFALLATVLASVGVAGVVAYAVARRGHEIGVRQALGANGRDVVRLILAEGLKLMALGLPVGLVFAAVGSRLLRTLLFGVQPGDPITYGAVAAVLGTVTLVSAWIPARRAAAVHPSTAFQSDG